MLECPQCKNGITKMDGGCNHIMYVCRSVAFMYMYLSIALIYVYRSVKIMYACLVCDHHVCLSVFNLHASVCDLHVNVRPYATLAS